MTKQAKLASHARLPDAARPLAMLTRFDSAMPTLKKRSGNFLAKCSVRVELWTSPSRTTMSGYSWPMRASARPNASRVDLPCLRFMDSALCKRHVGGDNLTIPHDCDTCAAHV